MLVDLRASRARITESRRWHWLTLLVGGALFLSTSKTAWIFMILEGAARAFPPLLRWAKSVHRRLRQGSLKIRLPRWRFVAAIVVAGVLIAQSLTMLSKIVDLNIFLSGTGLNNTAAHSLNDRETGTVETIAVFKEHPFLGLSLGGVSSRMSQQHGVVNDGKTYLGFPVIMDLLAASGVIGIIPFLLFIGTNTVGMFQLIGRRWPDERAKWLRALVRATIYESLMLSADQNVLRIYVWFHLSVLAAVALHLRHESNLLPQEQRLLPELSPKYSLHTGQ